MTIDVDVRMFALHLDHGLVLVKMGKLLLGTANLISMRAEKERNSKASQSRSVVLQDPLLQVWNHVTAYWDLTHLAGHHWWLTE